MREGATWCNARTVVIRCLIVDDNRGFLEAARELLEGEGFDVVGLAGTSAEAMAAARDLEPDLVLVDLYLGRESGFELARQLAQIAAPGGPAVILISTYAERDLAELVSESPAVGFLAKGELSGASIRSLLGLEDG